MRNREGMAVPAADTWHGRATWHRQAVPHCWPACRANFVWHGRATQQGVPVLDPRCFRVMLGDPFHGLKLASLALLSAKCRLSFRFFDKVPKNIERCYMSKMYAKGGRFDHFLTRLNVKTREKRSQIRAKMRSK